jgi:hypothetical protein
VLVSTTLSKAVLRVAAERLSQLPGVAYFPAYEIITAPSAGESYFAEDLRSIREQGVEHVMRVFFRHLCTTPGEAPPTAAQDPGFVSRMHGVVDAMCDEARLDPSPPD